MTIISNDGRMSIDVGSYEIWHALYSTVIVHFGADHAELQSAKDFLKTGECTANKAFDTARSMNHLRDSLSALKPSMIICDHTDLSKELPWKNAISPIVTSCGNCFTSADGEDLLSSLVSILTYSYYAKVDVHMI